ncbi:unnamed protein product [Blepharisma stoltei]|uniref:Uncharacterized protein n=1 Tax=Blepharisma stoltei TaxID=1481888 RepID=A0AAU9IAI6_9CILI|nr:unnamed protein product [Blepharisma stoltei]
MSQITDRLRSQNGKLREEIKKLQYALKEINNDVPISSFSQKEPKIHSQNFKNQNRYYMKQGLDGKIQKEVALREYPRVIEVSIKKKDTGCDPIYFESNSKSESLLDSSKQSNPFDTKKTINSSHIDSLFTSTLQNDSEDYIRDNFESPEFSKKFKNKNPERALKDSFDSYYESEQENLDKSGKCELSFHDYEKDHERGSRRKERNLLQEIESLRDENKKLRTVLKTSFSSNADKENRDTKVKKLDKSEEIVVIENNNCIESAKKRNGVKIKAKTPIKQAKITKSTTPRSKTVAKVVKKSQEKSKTPRKVLTHRSSTPRKVLTNRSSTPQNFSQSTTPKRSQKHSQSSISLSQRAERSLTPSRSHHCQKCDSLLTRGRSTFSCKKHGSCISKSSSSKNL